MDAIACLLFFFEFYHLLAHCCVLFRIRLLPRKDLVGVRYYFLADLVTVTLTTLYTGKLRWLAILQNIQHAFYFISWNKDSHTKRVISWSSLDWQYSSLAMNTEWLMVAGTGFDAFVHLANCYVLAEMISSVEAIVMVMVVQASALMILWNSSLAWSTPGNVPKWVEKRVQPVEEDKAVTQKS